MKTLIFLSTNIIMKRKSRAHVGDKKYAEHFGWETRLLEDIWVNRRRAWNGFVWSSTGTSSRLL
jgi:hypothetical protein